MKVMCACKISKKTAKRNLLKSMHAPDKNIEH
jgi:hypothetical protein